jgi:anthranilate synthase component 2
LGGKLVQKKSILHGKPVQLKVSQKIVLFLGVKDTITVGLYHSWEVKIPNNLHHMISAYDEHGVVMAVENHDLKLYGVQFHPESILTENGREILANFCAIS